jgi:XTP/dITP diphosphohydrolase
VTTQPELGRLVAVMHRLRAGCPWDAEQTHASLVRYLVEETLEVVEAIEAGDDTELSEELGDLLLQVVFHSEIASETGRFDIEDVARSISDKLIARHPYVFTDAEVPTDLVGSWERAKAVEKSRGSALDGIPERLSALTRAHKVLVRARSHGLDPDTLGVSGADVAADALGEAFLRLVARAEQLGLDPEQEARAALRSLEERVRTAEGQP